MHAGRTTNIASIISLLGAFLAAAVVMGLLAAGLVIPAVGATGAGVRAGIDVFDSLPTEFTASPLSQQSKILDAKGNVLATPYDENRVIVPLSAVSPIMKKAQVAIEDDRFYQHGGVDLRGLIRAVASNAQGTSTQGGSTLTQQYVKLMLQETALKAGDKAAADAAVARHGLAGVTRKLQELKYSIALEKAQTKDQILQGYLNLVYYGDQAYGVEAAAQHYFGHSAKTLNLAESALIAGLAQNPGTTDPVHAPAKALSRRNVVLDRMYELKLVSEKDFKAARALPLAKYLKVTPSQSSCASAKDNAYFCDYVLKYLEQDPSLNEALGKTVAARKKKIYGGGLTIQTTLDPAVSATARAAILDRVPEGNQYQIGSAAVIIDPTNGGVRGMAQNTTYTAASQDWSKTSVNWAVDKQYGGSNGFGFGSTEKAFALVTALESGLPITTSVNAKVAGPGRSAHYTSADFPGGVANCGLDRKGWNVKNDGTEGGRMTLTKATADSVNTAFVELVRQIGACKVRDTEMKMGIHQADGSALPTFVPSIILGAAEVSPMTVASAYGSLGNNGTHCTPVPIVSITGSDRKALPVPAPGKTNCQQVVDPDVAHGVASIMTHVLTEGTARASKLDGGRIAAGKTGTTDGNRQTWFVGYTPQLVTAVWTGTPVVQRDLDHIKLGSYPAYPVVFGASISAPVWKSIMDQVLAGQPNLDFPAPSDKIMNGEMTALPNVAGHTVADATALLEAAGFSVGPGRSINSNYRPGIVAGTDPAGQAGKGSSVSLLISAGPGAQAPPPPANPPPANPPATTAPVVPPPAGGGATPAGINTGQPAG